MTVLTGILGVDPLGFIRLNSNQQRTKALTVGCRFLDCCPLDHESQLLGAQL